MKNNALLLELYREEKALIIGQDPTGLEPFPSFPEWKSEYEREYNETHKTVTTKEADRLAEDAQAEFDRSGLTVDLDEGMSDNIPNVRKRDVQLVKPTVSIRRHTMSDNTTTTTPVSKASVARAIFAEDFGRVARKDVIARFMAEAGLTKAGAATYYQKFKKAAESNG